MKAFPLTTDQWHGLAEDKEVGGMDLRDYFAGLAMHADLINDPNEDRGCDKIAIRAYEMADEMMAARGGI